MKLAGVGYYLTALARFLALAIPLIIIVMSLFAWGLHSFGWQPSMEELGSLERVELLPFHLRLAGWAVESLALTALFLLIQGRSGAWWLDGLVAGMIGWVFRGPILVLSVVSMSKLGSAPWWPMSLRWLALYAISGILLSIVARTTGIER